MAATHDLKLSETKRKLLLAAAVYPSQHHGRAPTWRELRQMTGLKRRPFLYAMLALQKRGLIHFVPDEAGSTRITAAGLAAALGPAPAGGGVR